MLFLLLLSLMMMVWVAAVVYTAVPDYSTLSATVEQPDRFLGVRSGMLQSCRESGGLLRPPFRLTHIRVTSSCGYGRAGFSILLCTPVLIQA